MRNKMKTRGSSQQGTCNIFSSFLNWNPVGVEKRMNLEEPWSASIGQEHEENVPFANSSSQFSSFRNNLHPFLPTKCIHTFSENSCKNYKLFPTGAS